MHKRDGNSEKDDDDDDDGDGDDDDDGDGDDNDKEGNHDGGGQKGKGDGKRPDINDNGRGNTEGSDNGNNPTNSPSTKSTPPPQAQSTSHPDSASPPPSTARPPSQSIPAGSGGDTQGDNPHSTSISQPPSTSATTAEIPSPSSTLPGSLSPTISVPGTVNYETQVSVPSSGVIFTFSSNSDPAAPTSTELKGGAIASSGVPRQVNAGAIAGGVLGALVLLVLAFFAFVLLRRRRRRRTAPSAEVLNRSFPPAFVDSAAASYYPFGSVHATSSNGRSSISHTNTIGHGFTFPAKNRR
ncbi:hypothetical protein DXG01_015122 [Tephrocybe rancida]|nr:hypothetical protein DXG01_015122 [Tephrocybe rancida]